MKICLIGPGTHIPPKAWGAVEIIVWQYYSVLKKLNIDVNFISNKSDNVVIDYIIQNRFDIVHIMYDDLITLVPKIKNYCNKIIYTTHWAYIPQIISGNYMYNPFKNLIKYKTDLTIFALSKQIKDVYIKAGISDKNIKIIHNGACDESFQYKTSPDYPDRTIYVGKIELRKRQYMYTSIKSVYYVGQYHNSNFKSNNYLGSWDKDTLYQNLTNYSNILLMSDGEADPLVIKEALMCGLGVVCNEISSANLDKDKEFITIIPNDKFDDISYVEQAIEKNRKISLTNREKIRNYALEKFSWTNIIQNQYLKSVKKLL